MRNRVTALFFHLIFIWGIEKERTKVRMKEKHKVPIDAGGSFLLSRAVALYNSGDEARYLKK